MKKIFNNMLIRKIIWFLTALLMAAIFIFSARSVEASRKDSAMLMEKLRIVGNREEALDMSNSSLMAIHNLIRKQTHVIVFALLSVMFFLSAYGYWGKFIKTAGIAFLLTILYAVTDEIHQIFSHRGASARDVFIDAKGALIGLSIMVVIFFIIERTRLRCVISKIYNLEGNNA